MENKMELIKKNSEFKGVFAQPTQQSTSLSTQESMALKISSVDANRKTFTGEISWTSGKTRVRGKYNSHEINMVEYELVEGSRLLFPTIYEGDIIAASFSGIAYHADYEGTFYFEKI
jgi:hypothetical protein